MSASGGQRGAGRRHAAWIRGSLSPWKYAKRADLAELGDDRGFVAAVVDVLLEPLERRDLRQGAVPILGRCEVDEADAVGELEGRVAKPGGLTAVQLVVDGAHEPLVLSRPVGLDLVANHDLSHRMISWARWLTV